ncbi:MAG TPA: PaaI family thioesterase [Acidimicrobiia bacterium]|nr:PaaI family thioesterase [Acidimicrobiia bacterium]
MNPPVVEWPEFESYDEGVAEVLVGSARTAGGLPQYLDITVKAVGPGRLRAELAVRDELLTPFGNLHGGVVAGFVDHVLGSVLYPLLRRGQWAATTEFKLNYLAPVQRGTLVAESMVLSLTRRTAVVRVEVGVDGRPVCVAQGTLVIVDPRGSPPEGSNETFKR